MDVKFSAAYGRRFFYVGLSIALVVAATLPLDFQDHSHWRRVAWVPWLSGVVRPLDLVVNALLYAPLGFALRNRVDARSPVVVLVALALSTSMEVAQVWSHWRYPTATDVAMNVAGAWAGARWAARRTGRTLAATPPPA